MASSFEIVSGILFVTGSLDRATDQDLAQALEKYSKLTPPANRVVDMSNVRWLAPTGAKALIAAGQETAEKGASLRVLASRHVLQTLNLLGAKSWMNIESCLAPNARPGAPDQPGIPVGPTTPAEGEAAHAAPEGQSAAAGAPTAAASAAAGGAAPAADSSASHVAVAAPVAAAPAARTGGAFASAAENLVGGAHLLRTLLPNRRYSFHLEGGELMLGFVRERVGGSWVIVETAGTRKILNLDVVQYCEIM